MLYTQLWQSTLRKFLFFINSLVEIIKKILHSRHVSYTNNLTLLGMDYGRRNGGHNDGIRSSDDQNGLRSLCKNKVRMDRVQHFYQRPWRSYAERKIEKYVNDKTIGGK